VLYINPIVALRAIMTISFSNTSLRYFGVRLAIFPKWNDVTNRDKCVFLIAVNHEWKSVLKNHWTSIWFATRLVIDISFRFLTPKFILPPFQNIGRFDFSRFIVFAMHLDITYV